MKKIKNWVIGAMSSVIFIYLLAAERVEYALPAMVILGILLLWWLEVF